jgi:hypothetical protein
VENRLDIVSKIQKVSAPEGMYETIMTKIEDKKKNVISLTWIRSAAAAIFVLVAVETYLLSSNSLTLKNENTATVESIIHNSNNILYND